MRILNVCHPTLLLVALAVVPASTVQAEIGCILLEPAIRHTNGIPIARSEPRRTTSVTWQCNPDNLGYCGCHYYWPCCESLRPRNVWDAARNRYTPRELRGYRTYAGCVCPDEGGCSGQVEYSTADGIEPPGMIQIGQVSNSVVAPALNGPGVPVSPPGGFGLGR